MLWAAVNKGLDASRGVRAQGVFHHSQTRNTIGIIQWQPHLRAERGLAKADSGRVFRRDLPGQCQGVIDKRVRQGKAVHQPDGMGAGGRQKLARGQKLERVRGGDPA